MIQLTSQIASYCVIVLVTITGWVLQQQFTWELCYQCLLEISTILSASSSIHIMKYHQISGSTYVPHTHQHSHCIVISTNVQVSLTFAGNRAIIGSAIYTNNLDLCSWYSINSPYFYTNRSEILRWPFVSYRQLQNYVYSKVPILLYRNEFNSGHSGQNSSNQLLAVQTPAINFTVSTKSVSFLSVY